MRMIYLILFFIFSSEFIFLQTTISGKVTNINGEPLEGANVVIKGTETGTSTKMDGSYIINEAPNDATLVVSMVGYNSKTRRLGEKEDNKVQEIKKPSNIGDKEIDDFKNGAFDLNESIVDLKNRLNGISDGLWDANKILSEISENSKGPLGWAKREIIFAVIRASKGPRINFETNPNVKKVLTAFDEAEGSVQEKIVIALTKVSEESDEISAVTLDNLISMNIDYDPTKMIRKKLGTIKAGVVSGREELKSIPNDLKTIGDQAKSLLSSAGKLPNAAKKLGFSKAPQALKSIKTSTSVLKNIPNEVSAIGNETNKILEEIISIISNINNSLNLEKISFTPTRNLEDFAKLNKNIIDNTKDAPIIMNFKLSLYVIEMSELEVLASRATEKTAIAYTDVSKDEIALRLGSQDIPLAMNLVPSVYATNQGGGAGDARINVRGFNQRNVAIMINGIPVNDMENGWVYWSNWDGVADVTSSIQMQKGLSAQNLATPSIGGSMNIITDAAALERGGSFKQEVGAWGFLKSTINYNTGLLMDDKLALSGALVRKTGDGFYTGTWTDAWAYFFGATYNLNDQHRFQFYALGAPQRHGQNLYRLNIASLDRNFAESLDDYNADISEIPECGRDCSGTGSTVSDEAAALLGDQQFEMYTEYKGKRHEDNLINERENFFHKPQVALNHYFDINDKINLISSAYWSGGMGGGTGTYGSLEWDYSNVQRVVNYDATILENDSLGASSGILRNSNNRQTTVGLLSKLNFEVSPELKTQIGLDYRSARVYHVKTIRDLLGGDYFMTSDSEFESDNGQGGLGDPIDYNFTNYVNWLGLFGQVEYTVDRVKAFAMAGMTTVKYTHWNHFKDASNYDYSYVEAKDASDLDFVEGLGDATGGHANDLYIEADPISTFQLKGGVLYELGNSLSFLNAIPIVGSVYDETDVWFNFGLIDKAPIFDQVIQDWDAKMATDPKNEKFTAFEFGFNARSNDGTLASKFNVYNTSWNDRIATRYVQNEDGDDDIIYLTGINQIHTGIETEFAAQINDMFRIDLGLSYGNWSYAEDATGTYRDSDGTDQSYSYSLKDLKVGDAPQVSFNFGLTLSPIESSTIQLSFRRYKSFYSDWSPTSREFLDGGSPDREQPWKIPEYGILDLNASYDLPFKFGGAKAEVVLNIRNLLDEVYVQDATDNSRYNAVPFRVNDHSANAAEVYLGMPKSYNLGLKINF